MSKWVAQPRQSMALKRGEYEVLYGGARGGGKTDAGIVFMSVPFRHSLYRGLVIRKNADDLQDWVSRARRFYGEMGATWTGKPPVCKWPSGAELRVGHLKDENAYEKYQGHEYHRILIEELTQIETLQRYLMLISSCRTTVPELRPQVFATTNPGGRGHQWVRERFVDICGWGTPYMDSVSGRKRIFIPARVTDNPALMTADPTYVEWLKSLPEGLKAAWYDGSWDYVIGAAFPEVHRDVHGIDEESPPARILHLFDFKRMTPYPGVQIFRSFDWGFSHPFSVGWYFSDEKGRLYRYREMYGARGANQGVKLPARDVARKIWDIEAQHGEEISAAVADASIWARPSDQTNTAEKLVSVAEVMADEGVYFSESLSKDIKKPHSRLSGKWAMHERLRLADDGLPRLFVFNSCSHWWRTVPAMQLDELNPEDVDTKQEDHAYDETRYFCLARPDETVFTREAPAWSVNWVFDKFVNKHHDREDAGDYVFN